MISDAVLTHIVITTPATILAFATLIVSIKSSKKVEEVHKATNGMKDALIAATEKEAHARGAAEGRAAVVKEQKDSA